MKPILKYTLLVLLAAIAFAACKSTDPLAKQKAIEALDSKISSSRYTFEANRASPMSGKDINLTSRYTLRVTPDSVVAFLPYFGRAYSAPNPMDEGGIKFTSTNFEYQVSDKKKGIYRVTLGINDNSQNYRLSLLIGEDGSGTLHVNQIDRQSITFYGDID